MGATRRVSATNLDKKMIKAPIARHKRIQFRPAVEADVEFVLGAEAIPENSEGILPWSREQHLLAMVDPDVAYWIIEAKPDSHLVGFMIFRGLRNQDKSIELKRILITEKGCGFGREALQLAKEIAFTKFEAHRFWLDVFTENQHAHRLYESEGFVREGLLRECHKAEQNYKSLIILSILESEYRE